MDEKILLKIEKKQRNILTDIDLFEYGYARNGNSKQGIQKWALLNYKNAFREKYKEKIVQSQKIYYIKNRNEILKQQKDYYRNNREIILQKGFEYHKINAEEIKNKRLKYYSEHKEKMYCEARAWKKENPEWVKQYYKEYYNKNRLKMIDNQKRYRENHPERIREYNKRRYEENREEMIAYSRRYSKTERGRELHRIHNFKHNKKGFIPLNDFLREAFDWHHIHKELPFVMAVPRDTHRKHGGKIHCDFVNKRTSNTIFVNENEDITSKEFVEAKVEILYPEQFRQYWFGYY